MTLGNSPERGEPLPKKTGERGGTRGGGCSLLVQREARGGTGERGGQGGPGVQDPEPRAEKFGAKLGERRRGWERWGGGSERRDEPSGGGRGRVRGRPESPPVVTPSAGIRAREHLLVLSPKAWSGALSCDWPTGRPSRVAKTRADWATAATFSSHPRRRRSLGRPGEEPALRLFPGEDKGTPTETGRASPREMAAAETGEGSASVCLSFYVCLSP